MDYSALSEAQLQQYYSSQQQQQQQQDPHYHQQAAYGQSYEAYYATYHHQNQQHDASQYHQQQYAASAYPHHQQYYYTAQDSSSYYQTGLTQPETMGVGPANPSQIHGYAASAAAPPQDQQHGPGLNPAAATAAVAALSQLSQFADTMDRAAAVADRHWHGKGGPPPPGPQHAHPGSRVHSKKRNKLEQQRMNTLVFIKYNLALRARNEKRKEASYDPISLSDMESDDEWITEKDVPSLSEDVAWLDTSCLEEDPSNAHQAKK